ncbi:hypothetical protein [Haloglycomyces albus]|uniref:hypothetical protein n=1 Tax=Haloglycomyces albus TaxID=526067 RepID=UPI00046CDBCF|nr:hypothetical protein [Haloglycomyces albus]
MRTIFKLFTTAGAAALTLGLPASAAGAAESTGAEGPEEFVEALPDGQHVTVNLKDHPELPLGLDEDGLALTSEGDHWIIRDVTVAPDDDYDLQVSQVIHSETGRCLSAAESDVDAVSRPVLVDCPEATAWNVQVDWNKTPYDFAFFAPDGRTLQTEGHRAEPNEPVILRAPGECTKGTCHFEEWHVTFADEGPGAPVDHESPESSAQSKDEGEPTLATTGLDMTVLAAATAFALLLAAGAVVFLRFQRTKNNW